MFLSKLRAGLREDFQSPVPYICWVVGGAVCVVTGPYGTLAENSFSERFIFWFGILSVGSFGGTFLFRVMRILCEGRSYLFMAAIGTAIFALLYAAFIYQVNAWWFRPGFPPGYLDLLVVVGVITITVKTLVYRFDVLPKKVLEDAEAAKLPSHLAEIRTDNPFLSKLRLGAKTRLIRLTVRDHYIEAHTDEDMQMVYMGLGDAVEALSAINGAQVHRSHWINWDEVETVARKGGRVFAQMSDGSEVPISRSKVRDLKKRGYL